MTAKRLLVIALDWLCGRIDALPWYEDGRQVCAGWGCRLGLARWSYQLDERWGTRAWERP